MKSMPIERLIEWAVRYELPKLSVAPSSCASSWQIAERHAALGRSVDVSKRITDVELSFPHRDALTIGAAIDDLDKRTEIDWNRSRAHLLGDLANLAGDADRSIVFDEAKLVKHHGRRGGNPIWNVGEPKPTPETGPNGKPKPIGVRYGKDRYSENAHCRLIWSHPEIDSVIFARAQYAVWHNALLKLTRSLKGRMSDHEALPTRAHPEPWHKQI